MLVRPRHHFLLLQCLFLLFIFLLLLPPITAATGQRHPWLLSPAVRPILLMDANENGDIQAEDDEHPKDREARIRQAKRLSHWLHVATVGIEEKVQNRNSHLQAPHAEGCKGEKAKEEGRSQAFGLMRSAHAVVAVQSDTLQDAAFKDEPCVASGDDCVRERVVCEGFHVQQYATEDAHAVQRENDAADEEVCEGERQDLHAQDAVASLPEHHDNDNVTEHASRAQEAEAEDGEVRLRNGFLGATQAAHIAVRVHRHRAVEDGHGVAGSAGRPAVKEQRGRGGPMRSSESQCEVDSQSDHLKSETCCYSSSA